MEDPRDKPEGCWRWERQRRVKTRGSLPDMPKFQPCPKGHGIKKRVEKTQGGATYWCNVCRESFFIKAKEV